MNNSLSKQIRPQDEDPLIKESRNSFIREQDSILNQKLRIDALEQTFTSLMIDACEKYHDLMTEILKHEKFCRLRLSFLRDVCIEISYGWDRSFSFVPVKMGERGYFHFASCMIQKGESGFEPFLKILDSESVISGKTKVSASSRSAKLLKYFIKHYSHDWLNKKLRKELKRCIANKRFESDARVEAVS